MLPSQITVRLIIVLSLIGSARAGTAAATWTGTSFIQAGSKIIVLNGVHQNGGNLYTYTYSPAFSATPYTALGLIGFEATNLNEYKIKFKINIPNYTSTTSLQISMVYPTTTSWRQFRVSYIAIDAIFSQVRVDYIQISALGSVASGTGLRALSGVFNLNISPVNTSHKISIIPLLIGVESHAVNGEHIFYWETKLRTASSISYKLTADRTTHIFELVSYILVVDRTSAENGLEIFMDELYIGGRNNGPVYQAPVYYNISNIHAGLNSGSFSLLGINFDKSSFLLSTVGYYQFLNLSVWSYRERTCPALQPYYEVNSNLCYDSCPLGFVNSVGPTKKYCKSCGDFITACLECSASGSSCTLCVGNYVASGSTCSCPQGFYVQASEPQLANRCRPCDASCITCNGPNNNNCLSCSSDRHLNNSMCVCAHGAAPNGACFASACRDQACLQCNSDPNLCQTCLTGFVLEGARCKCAAHKYFEFSSVSCLPCHYSCLYCSGPSANSCTSCDRAGSNRYLSESNECLCIQGYSESNGTCVLSSNSCTEPGYTIDAVTSSCIEICGDGNRIRYACDDGNLEDGDGCSSICSIEEGYVCSENVLAPNKRSFCSYTQPIHLELASTLKHVYSNTISMNLTMQPTLTNVLSAYSDLSNHLQVIAPSVSIEVNSARFNSELRILEVQFSYDANLQSQEVNISLSMPETALSYAIPLSTALWQVGADNKLTATANSQKLYSSVASCKIMGMTGYAGGLAAFILLMFFRKMIGLEYIIMLQLIYFSFTLTDYVHAFLGPIQEWQFINGYNQIRTNIGAKLVANQFWVIGFYDYFYVNCNVMLFVCLANYGFAGIMYGLSLASDRSVSRKLKTSALYFAVDIGFALIMFSVNNIIVSLYLEIEAGHIFSFTYGVDKFFVILAILMLLGQMAAYFMKIHDVLDSQLFYHRNKNYSHFYPFVFLLRNLLVIIFMVLAIRIGKVSSYIILGVQVAYIIAVLAGRPYKRYIDYARFAAVQLTLLLLLVCRFVQANVVTNFSEISSTIASFVENASMFVLIGANLALFMSIAAFGFHLWKGRTQEGQVAPEQQAEDGEVYVPPINFSNSQEKFKSKEQEKSKEIMIFDVQQEEGGAGVPTDYLGQSIFEQSSKRKLRSRPMNMKSKQFY